MSLEQWEKELIKYFEIKNSEIPSSKNKSNGTFASKNTNNDTFLMMLLFVVLGISIFIAYDFKTDGYIQKMVFSEKPEIEKNIPIIERKEPIVQNKEIETLKEEMKKNKDILDKIVSKTQSNTDRIALMGVMINENFCIDKNNFSKEDMIFLNRDWTLNKMPKYIILSEDDKEYLNKYVKPQ
jgi:hypothetical protein